MDFEKLRQKYIVVPLEGIKLDDYAEKDVRELEQDFDTGVKALWCEEEETLLAFLFVSGTFTQEKAEEWVAAVEEEGVNLDVAAALSAGDASPAYFRKLLELLRKLLPEKLYSQAVKVARAHAGGLASPKPKDDQGEDGDPADGDPAPVPVPASLDDESFQEITSRLRGLIENQFGPKGNYPGPVDYDNYPWVKEVYKDHCIIDWKGELYRIDYSFGDDDEIILEEPVRVKVSHVPAEMYVFNIALSSEEPPSELDDDDDLIWKEILMAGTTFRPSTGDELAIEQEMIDGAYDAFAAGVLDNVAITADDHHFETGGIVPADKTVGFVRKLKKVGSRLWAALEILDEKIREKVDSGLIKDVSIFACPNFHDRRDGKRWPWVLMHLLLTNYPQLVGLAPFGARPVGASAADGGEGIEPIFYTQISEEGAMPEGMVLTDEQAAEFAAFQTLNLSTADVQQMLDERGAMQAKARDMEISAVVAALEGRGEHSGVVAMEGHRHYPVVIQAVEAALRENGGEALALSIDGDGRSRLDDVVLSLVNALPEEARMALEQPPAAPPSGNVQGDEPPSDDAIEALDNALR